MIHIIELIIYMIQSVKLSLYNLVNLILTHQQLNIFQEVLDNSVQPLKVKV